MAKKKAKLISMTGIDSYLKRVTLYKRNVLLIYQRVFCLKLEKQFKGETRYAETNFTSTYPSSFHSFHHNTKLFQGT